MKNTKGFTLIELFVIIAIIAILAATVTSLVVKNKEVNEVKINIKEDKNFSQDSLYSSDKKIEVKNNPENPEVKNLFHAKLVGEMTCEGFYTLKDKKPTKLKVYEFCYNGIKYFAIAGGYMAPKMFNSSKGVFYEVCGEN